MPIERRKSFAPSSTAGKARSGIGRKRAHSLVPNPRQPAPRKSILKSNFSFNVDQHSQDNVTSEADDGNDKSGYTVALHDNDTRKSMSRRVSFAAHALVREFENNEQNTNSSGAPSSSPVASPSSQSKQSSPGIRIVSNENDYPGRRRSASMSRRYSNSSGYGEASMSMDVDEDSSDPPEPIFIPSRLPAEEGLVIDSPNLLNSEENYEMTEDEDMEMTEAIESNIRRKRSLSTSKQDKARPQPSLSPPRQSPSIMISLAEEVVQQEIEYSEAGDTTTTSQGSESDEVPMDFTIPIGEPLKPQTESEAWAALQAASNTYTTEVEDGEEEMELTTALSRLQKARDSIALGGTGDSQGGQYEEPSFASTEDSMDSIDIGDRTVNVTSLMGSVENLEISDITSEGTERIIDEAQIQTSVMEERTEPQEMPKSEVLVAPGFSIISTAQPNSHVLNGKSGLSTDRQQELHIHNLPSKLKPPSNHVFSAPSRSPLGSTRVTSPMKTKESTIHGSPARKRPATAENGIADSASRPSPAKKRVTELNTAPLVQSQVFVRGDVNGDLPKAEITTSQTGTKSGLGLRRPSGYFSQRRSLAPTTGNSLDASTSSLTQEKLGALDSTISTEQVRRVSIAATNTNHQHREEIEYPTVQPPSDSVASTTNLPTSVGIEKNGIEPESRSDEADQKRRRLSVVREVSPGDEADFGNDLPGISIEEFFMMTGVKFMDELTIPRRSMVHPSQLGNRKDSDSLPSKAEFVAAMNIHIPQLQLYSWVTKDLQTWIDNCKQIYAEAEDDVAKVTPSLFREFLEADEEGRAELMHQLKLIKANKHSAAKEKWYEWKYQWIENLHEIADKGYAELEEDEKALEAIIRQAEDLLPTLRQQHSQILLELEKERTEIAQLEESDPSYLEELKAAIDEQNQLLDVYRADVAEGNAKLDRLDEKLAELEVQKKESRQAIEEAERRIITHKSSTRAEVFRLRDELDSLEVLHAWRIKKVLPQLLELVYDDAILVAMPCVKYRPIAAEISIVREGGICKKQPDTFPFFSDLVVRQSQVFVRGLSSSSAKKIVEELNDFWASCAQIRSQLKFLSIKFPLRLEPLPPRKANECSGFKAVASVMLHRYKAKALVSFVFEKDVLSHWPFAIRSLKCEVQVAYGDVNASEVRHAVMERLSEATVDDNHACLLDACVEAASRYDP